MLKYFLHVFFFFVFFPRLSFVFENRFVLNGFYVCILNAQWNQSQNTY